MHVLLSRNSEKEGVQDTIISYVLSAWTLAVHGISNIRDISPKNSPSLRLARISSPFSDMTRALPSTMTNIPFVGWPAIRLELFSNWWLWIHYLRQAPSVMNWYSTSYVLSVARRNTNLTFHYDVLTSVVRFQDHVLGNSFYGFFLHLLTVL